MGVFGILPKVAKSRFLSSSLQQALTAPPFALEEVDSYSDSDEEDDAPILPPNQRFLELHQTIKEKKEFPESFPSIENGESGDNFHMRAPGLSDSSPGCSPQESTHKTA